MCCQNISNLNNNNETHDRNKHDYNRESKQKQNSEKSKLNYQEGGDENDLWSLYTISEKIHQNKPVIMNVKIEGQNMIQVPQFQLYMKKIINGYFQKNY